MFKFIANLITYNILNLQENSSFAISVEFFLYSIFKILFLIFIVVFIISFLRTFFPASKIKKMTLKARFGSGNIIAAVFGAATPFCSCSSIPIFIGFLKTKIPIGVAFSFLITSPLVNEIALVMMGGLFGWRLAIIYALSGIALGVIGGIIIGKLKPEKDIILSIKEQKKPLENLPKEFGKKIKYAYLEGKNTFRKLIAYVIAGVAVGAVIYGYVPQEFFMNYVGMYDIFAVPVAVIIGIPVYAGCSTVVPLIFSITAGGVPLGTSLAFMMSIAGLSLPEAIILKKIMSAKILALFFSIVTVGIIVIGYLFNFIAE